MNESLMKLFLELCPTDEDRISWNENVPDISISKNIEEIAEEKGISDKKLAKSVGITVKKLIDIKYDIFEFNDDLVKKFAIALETDVKTLKVIREDLLLPLNKDIKK